MSWVNSVLRQFLASLYSSRLNLFSSSFYVSRIDYLILHVITGIMLDPKEIAGLMEDLFLGSQWSIILGYRRLSVKSLLAFSS